VPLITPSGGSAGAATAQIALTDAQIKTLPTTPIVLVAATQTLAFSGVPSSLPVPISCSVIVKRPAGDYTNLDAALHAKLAWGSDEDIDVSAVENPIGTQATAGAAFGGGSGAKTRGIFVLSSANSFGSITLDNQLQDNALVLAMSNGALGNLTGGGAANSAVVSLLYYTIAI
jgi:hypothetical protein